MQRREMLRILAAGAALPALSPDVFAFYRASHPPEGYGLRTLNPHQNATVVAMIDQIIPETDTPGAKAARVNEFIDVILTEWANDDERKSFLDGLADVDKKSNELFGKDFIDASPAQQLSLLRAMDEAAAFEASTRRLAPTATISKSVTNNSKTLSSPSSNALPLHGYYTSEIGFTQELKLQIIPGALHGCVPRGPGLGTT